jgi:hypothetical protein
MPTFAAASAVEVRLEGAEPPLVADRRRIEVESQEARGSAFTFAIPRE